MKIGIAGCAGRMGRLLAREVYETDGLVLTTGSEHMTSEHVGADVGDLAGVGPLGLSVVSDPRALFSGVEGVIDFSSPEATVTHARLAAERGAVFVSGTTGLSDSDIDILKKAAEEARIVHAPNMSAGVNLLLAMVEKVAAGLDETFDIEIQEMHHRHKADAPSGTALALGAAAAKGRQADLSEVACKSREGHTGPRPAGEIGFATLRGGDVAGEHTVMFAGEGERVELGHKATSRRIFTRGAVRALKWAADQPPGLYSMRDVLGL